ncbi:hypothetical protein HMI56_002162, partial [Coelomomyces lativittatus]
VISLTTNGGNTRFNPNIYSNGKVCLSLLGTWGGNSIEQWSSVHGIFSSMISIQSLMCEKPFHNEPGFEQDSFGHETSLITAYSSKIVHETIRISVCDRLESYEKSHEANVNPFKETCKYLFGCYYFRYLDIIETESKNVEPNEMFQEMPFEYFCNTMYGKYSYPELKSRLQSLYAAYIGETESWVTQSLSWTDTEHTAYTLLMEKYEEIQSNKYLDGSMVIVLHDSNPFVWHLTTFGQPATPYEEGIFHIQIVFHHTFPESRPRIKFITPFFHPNVSNDGIIYYGVSPSEDVKMYLDAVLFLFTKNPESHPATHLNKTASELYFGSPEKKREYSLQARKCAANSLE